jgi:hypothetical protein
LHYKQPNGEMMSKLRKNVKKQFRKRVTFWLDFAKREEDSLGELIETLKEERKFAKTVRDGIRLICDLRAGKLDLLLELFPWVKTKLLTELEPHENALERTLREYMERFEQQYVAPKTLNSTVSGGPKPLNVPRLDVPKFDDDDLDTLVVKKDTSTDASLNFINAMMRLQQ